MKCLLLLLLAAGFTTCAAQSPDGQSGQTTTAAYAVARVSAEFTKKIDTKDAKVGDEISARITADSTLPDGTELRKGMRLIGAVVQVHSKGGGNPTSLLAFTLDGVAVPGGREIRVHTTLTSLSGPQRVTVREPVEAVDPTTLAGAPETSRNSGRNGGNSSRAQTPMAPSRGTLASLDAAAATVPHSNGPTGLEDPRAAGSSAKGTYVSDAIQVHHYPVANMPGVILSSQITAAISGVLDSPAQNIRVESGTKMTMDASVVEP